MAMNATVASARRRHSESFPSQCRLATGNNRLLNTLLATTGDLIADHRIASPLETAFESVTYSDRVLTLVGNEASLDPPLWLCGPCKRLMEAPPPAFNLEGQLLENWPTLPAEYWTLHHDNLFQLIDCCFGPAGEHGACQFCLRIWRGICRQIAPGKLTPEEYTGSIGALREWLTAEPHLNCHQGLRVSRYIEGDQCRLGFNIPLPIRNLNFFGFLSWLNWRLAKSRKWFLLLCTYTQNPSDARPLPANSTNSRQTYTYVQERIRECRKTHPLCQLDSVEVKDYPTRLIRVAADTRKVYLEDRKSYTDDLSRQNHALQKPQSGLPPYLALSYRWGSIDATSPQQRVMLARITDKDLRSGLSIADLPRVIRDACEVVAKLGYRYLWADRLCIFQDSSEDWNNEAARMAQIYAQSDLVLSASYAADEDATMFAHRGPNGGGVQPLRLQSTRLLPEGLIEKPELPDDAVEQSETSSFIIVDGERPHSHDPVHGQLGWLAERGWIFQERALPRRIVHFSGEEVHWECRQLEENETGAYQRTEKKLTRLMVALGSQDAPRNLHLIWCDMVSPYTWRSLTFEEDRLPAISGLARETQRLLRRDVVDEAYYAGLWKSTFIADLCWQDKRQTLRREALRTSRTYIAPSWSWASYHIQAHWAYSGDTSEFVHFADLVTVQLKHHGGNEFGAVQDGYMVLHGHLIPVEIGAGWLNDQFWGDVKLEIWGSDMELLDWFITFNGCIEVQRLMEAVEDGFASALLLPLRKKDSHKGGYMCWCLLLAPIRTIEYDDRSGETLDYPVAVKAQDGKGVVEYQRIGYIEMEVQDNEAWWAWVARYPKQDIVVR